MKHILTLSLCFLALSLSAQIDWDLQGILLGEAYLSFQSNYNTVEISECEIGEEKY